MFSAFLSSNSLTLMEKLVIKHGEVNYELRSGDMKGQGHTQTKLGLMASNMEGNDAQNKILGEQN